MAGKTAQRSATRKAKYTRQFDITAKNKARNISKMKEANPNWPQKRSK